MGTPAKDQDFNETLRRMMEVPPKEHKDMKKGRSQASDAKRDKKEG